MANKSAYSVQSEFIAICAPLPLTSVWFVYVCILRYKTDILWVKLVCWGGIIYPSINLRSFSPLAPGKCHHALKEMPDAVRHSQEVVPAALFVIVLHAGQWRMKHINLFQAYHINFLLNAIIRNLCFVAPPSGKHCRLNSISGLDRRPIRESVTHYLCSFFTREDVPRGWKLGLILFSYTYIHTLPHTHRVGSLVEPLYVTPVFFCNVLLHAWRDASGCTLVCAWHECESGGVLVWHWGKPVMGNHLEASPHAN